MQSLIPKTSFNQIKSYPQTWMMIISLFLCVTVCVGTVKYMQSVAQDANAEKKECQASNAALINTLLIKNHIIDAIKTPTSVDTTGAIKQKQNENSN
jgi:hypothetical protein